MNQTFSYACKDYPGMEECPGKFVAQTEEELWKHMELHAAVAHGEDPSAWSAEDREQLRTLIRREG
mgnify:CR=1 FL=1